MIFGKDRTKSKTDERELNSRRGSVVCIKRRRSSLPAIAQGEGAELRELACSDQCNAAHFFRSLFFAECLDFAPVVLAAPLPAGPMLHLISPLRLHCFLSTFVGRVAIRDVRAPSLWLQRHPRRIYAGRSSTPSVRQRAGAASYYDAPQNTGTERPFVHDLDSPGLLLDVVIRPLIVCTGLTRCTVGGPLYE